MVRLKLVHEIIISSLLIFISTKCPVFNLHLNTVEHIMLLVTQQALGGQGPTKITNFGV